MGKVIAERDFHCQDFSLIGKESGGKKYTFFQIFIHDLSIIIPLEKGNFWGLARMLGFMAQLEKTYLKSRDTGKEM